MSVPMLVPYSPHPPTLEEYCRAQMEIEYRIRYGSKAWPGNNIEELMQVRPEETLELLYGSFTQSLPVDDCKPVEKSVCEQKERLWTRERLKAMFRYQKGSE